MRSANAFLLYDSHCGPCSRFMKAIKKLDRKNEIMPVSLYSRLALDLVGQMLSKREMMSSFHLVVKDAGSGRTQIFSAGNGVIQLLRYMPGGSVLFPVARKISPVRASVRWLYKQVAKLRLRSVACAIKR